jgi:hypothetical protein
MSDLRDARLRRALEEAPDAGMQPDPRIRKAVLEAAREAIAAPQVTWWQRLWQGLGQRNMGWNAALATVLMATVITALWYEREIPGARPESAAQRTPESPAAPAAKPQPRSSPAPAQRSAESRERRAEGAVDAMRDQAVREELAKSAPAPAAPAAPAAAPAPQAMSRAAPAAGLASQAESPVAANWTHARIAMQGRSVDFAREQVTALAELLGRMARETHTQEPLQAKADARIELTRSGAPAGAIELAGAQLRWIRPGGNSSTTRPDAAQLQALREELSRLLQR